MNIYYAPPEQIHNGFIELLDQEVQHASKVMRASEGDNLVVVDGEGKRYNGLIRRITGESIQIEIKNSKEIPEPKPTLILGMGIIKKRDRLEFAVEKAVELGASEICLFRSRRTVKQNVRMDRLESIAISAMKQSMRAFLPSISVFNSAEEVIDVNADALPLVAHEKVDKEEQTVDLKALSKDRLLLMVGPEGGFAPKEIEEFENKGCKLVSLGKNRLRAETAAVAFLSQFLG